MEARVERRLRVPCVHPRPAAKIVAAPDGTVGRIHFAGAAHDNLPSGMDAATRSAIRVAAAIHAA
ncbi:MAG: FAD-dependent oxidoreductase [Opitutaceae bacterium]